MTAQALADRCGELGHPLDRSVIAKLEKGIRQTVTVADLLVLARALDLPPVALLFPLDEPGAEVLPGELRSVWSSLQWFAAEAPFPPADAREADPRWEPPAPIQLFRQHEDLVRQCVRAASRAADLRVQATLADGEERTRLEAVADDELAGARALREVIQGMRKALRSLHHEPPLLPKPLQSLDVEVD
jgi:transcriptional regulator with XRE-family HTH domain